LKPLSGHGITSSKKRIVAKEETEFKGPVLTIVFPFRSSNHFPSARSGNDSWKRIEDKKFARQKKPGGVDFFLRFVNIRDKGTDA
jgi:hypothetical protein